VASNVLTATVTVSFDGAPASFSPICLTLEEGAVQQYELFGVTKAADSANVYTLIPTVDAFTTITALLGVNHYGDVAYRFQHQADSGVPVQSGGLLLLLGSRIDSGRLTNVLAHVGAKQVLNGLVCGSTNLDCPSAVVTNLTVDFTAPDSGETIISWDWDFGDGNTQETTIPTVTHTYAIAGTYSVSVRENISGGGSVAVGGCPVTVLPPFEVPCPEAVVDGLGVDFTEQAIPGATNYHWNFDDGIEVDTGPVNTVHHDYADFAIYDVVVTVSAPNQTGTSGVCPVDVCPECPATPYACYAIPSPATSDPTGGPGGSPAILFDNAMVDNINITGHCPCHVYATSDGWVLYGATVYSCVGPGGGFPNFGFIAHLHIYSDPNCATLVRTVDAQSLDAGGAGTPGTQHRMQHNFKEAVTIGQYATLDIQLFAQGTPGSVSQAITNIELSFSTSSPTTINDDATLGTCVPA